MMRKTNPFIMPALFLLLAASLSFAQSAPSNWYKAGVRSFIDGKNEKAIEQLKLAIDENDKPDKAKKLLTSVYKRSLKTLTTRGKNTTAKEQLQEAHQVIGDKRPFAEFNYLLKPKKAAAPPRSVAPAKKPIQQKATPPPQRRNPERNQPRPPSPDIKTKKRAMDRNPAKFDLSSGHLLWFLIFLLLTSIPAVSFVINYKDQIHRMEKENNFLRLHLQKEKEKRQEIETELRIIQEAEARAENILRRNTNGHVKPETRPPQSLPRRPIKPVNMKSPLPPPAVPLHRPHALPATPAPATNRTSLENKMVRQQESRILNTLVDISPEKRRESWNQVAKESADFYLQFPDEAIRFLKKTAEDGDKWSRACILTALGDIGTVETLEILLTLASDPAQEVRREAIKIGNQLLQRKSDRLPEPYADLIQNKISEEVDKDEWII